MVAKCFSLVVLSFSFSHVPSSVMCFIFLFPPSKMEKKKEKLFGKLEESLNKDQMNGIILFEFCFQTILCLDASLLLYKEPPTSHFPIFSWWLNNYTTKKRSMTFVL